MVIQQSNQFREELIKARRLEDFGKSRVVWPILSYPAPR